MARITREMLRARLDEQLAITPSSLLKPQPDYRDQDLTSIPGDEAFLIEAYRRILERPPDVEGICHFLRVLKTHPRQIVVDALTQTRQNLRVSTQPTKPSASTFVELDYLEQFDNPDALVKESYRAILGRDGDPGGIMHFRSLLACGAPKMQVISILAASEEALARNVRFFWHGAALPPPGRLGWGVRLRLLVWNLTGRNVLEDDLLFARSALHTMQMRYEALQQDFRAVSTSLGAIQAGMAKIHDEAVAQIDKLGNQVQDKLAEGRDRLEESRRFTSALAAGLEGLADKLDAVTSAVQKGHEAIRLRQDHAIAQMAEVVARVRQVEGLADKLDTVTNSVQMDHEAIRLRQEHGIAEIAEVVAPMRQQVAGGLAGILDKLDAIATDVRIREEGIQLGQDQNQAIITQQIESIHEWAQAITAAIRPPVLSGTDVLVTKVDDFVLAVPREDWSLAAYYSYWGTVDLGLSRHISTLLRPGMVVVDIGANVGLHTLQAARAVGNQGKVFSFEPTPRTFDVLRRNVEASGLTCIELFPYAVLDRHDQLPLYLHDGASPLNTLFGGGNPGKSVRVEAVTLDEVLGSQHIDFIKIDAEGAEAFILRGMKRILAENPALVVALEFSPIHLQRAGMAATELIEELQAAGFDIRLIDGLTGELSIPTRRQLLSLNSCNLHLQRSRVQQNE